MRFLRCTTRAPSLVIVPDLSAVVLTYSEHVESLGVQCTGLRLLGLASRSGALKRPAHTCAAADLVARPARRRYQGGLQVLLRLSRRGQRAVGLRDAFCRQRLHLEPRPLLPRRLRRSRRRSRRSARQTQCPWRCPRRYEGARPLGRESASSYCRHPCRDCRRRRLPLVVGTWAG